ncbi:hypothetical protein [Vibrio splendidus]|uniref:hypothetical protein n=1 Tax=Vibrio splendidus TaxID=29497 RepID=UPI003D0C36C5
MVKYQDSELVNEVTQTLSYPTGRTYDKEQVLEASVIAEREGVLGTEYLVVFFDAARRMDGVVEVDSFDGRSILEAYDNGEYSHVSLAVKELISR